MTLLRCTICKLPAEKLAAINSSLLGGASQQTVATEHGLSKAGTGRHARHLPGYNAAAAQPKGSDTPIMAERTAPGTETAVPAPPKAALPAKTPPPAPQETALTVPAPEAPPLDVKAKLERAEGRLEHLWGEALDGLEASKVPVVLTKADGSIVEVHNHSARASFIRVAKDIIQSQIELAQNQAPSLYSNVTFANVILMPKTPDIEGPEGDELELPSRTYGPDRKIITVKPEPKIINVTPEPPSLADILGPPGSKK